MTTTLKRRRGRASGRRRRSRIRRWIAFIRQTGACALCGSPHRPGRPLTYHHVGPKRFRLSRSRHRTRTVVAAELAKCSLLCWPCHEALHRGRISPDPAALVLVQVPDLASEPPAIGPPPQREPGPGTDASPARPLVPETKWAGSV